MKNIFISLILIYLCMSCNNIERAKLQDKYSSIKKTNSYIVKFKNSHDSIFLTYYFVFNDGNYINAPDDSTDYAGFFLKKDIKDNIVKFKIKDYREYWRDTTRVYNLELKFPSDSSLVWYIDSIKYGIFDYLPNYIELRASK